LIDDLVAEDDAVLGVVFVAAAIGVVDEVVTDGIQRAVVVALGNELFVTSGVRVWDVTNTTGWDDFDDGGVNSRSSDRDFVADVVVVPSITAIKTPAVGSRFACLGVSEEFDLC